MTDFRIRRGSAADARAAAVANVEGWRDTFDGVLPAEFLQSMSVDRREASLAGRFSEPGYGMHVAEVEGVGVVGFADWGPSRYEAWQDVSELYALYLLPKYQGKGIGRALFGATARAVLAEGDDRLILSVLGSNPNVSFYDRLGGEVLDRGTMTLADTEHEVVYYSWSAAALAALVGP